MEKLFLYLGIASALFLLIFGIFRWICKKQGTWSSYISPPSLPKPTTNSGGGLNESAGEARTRVFLEQYFPGKRFIRVRPDFLRNAVTGGKFNLELDCFNEELGLAVEFQGRQHYFYTPRFHSSKEAFYNQKYRDELKRIYCRDRGITLIEVPFTAQKELEGFLEQSLKSQGYVSA